MQPRSAAAYQPLSDTDLEVPPADPQTSDQTPQAVQLGRLTSVRCATDISAEAKDHFLQMNLDFLDAGETDFVFVDSLTHPYDQEDEIDEMTASDPDSPFRGTSAAECVDLLLQLRRAGADIDTRLFCIFDARLLVDDSVVVVSREDSDDEASGDEVIMEVVAVRMEAQIVQFQLSLYASGKSGLREDRVKGLRHADGVVRAEDDMLTSEEEETLYGAL